MNIKVLFYTFLLFVIQVCPSRAAEKKPPHSNSKAGGSIYIAIHFDAIKDGDSLTIIYSDKILKPSTIVNPSDIAPWLPHRKATVITHTSTGAFSLTDFTPGYISIETGDSRSTYLYQYFAEPGDSIQISISSASSQQSPSAFDYCADLPNYRYTFNGRGALKYTLRYQMDEKLLSLANSAPMSNRFNIFTAFKEKKIRMIDRYRGHLTRLASDMLKIDIASEVNLLNVETIHRAINYKDSLRHVPEYIVHLTSISEKIGSSKIQLLSKGYAYFILQKSITEYRLLNIAHYDFNNVYAYLKQKYNNTPDLRDKLITMLFINHGMWINKSDSLIKDALETVRPGYAADILDKMYNSYTKGKEAYNFSLPDTSGKLVTLSNFKGKVVFIDFWYTGCGACKAYYQYDLSYVEDEFRNNDKVAFITISIDKSRDMWLKSIANGEYTSKNVTNLYTAGRALQSPVIEHYMVKTYPHPMIIDRFGKVFQFNGIDLRQKDKLIAIINNALKE